MSTNGTGDGGSSVLPAYLTAILRWGGTALAGWLVDRGIVNSDASAWIGAAVLGLGALTWSLLQKRATAKVLTVAQTSRAPLADVPAVPK